MVIRARVKTMLISSDADGLTDLSPLRMTLYTVFRYIYTTHCCRLHGLSWGCAFKYSCLKMHLPPSHLSVVPHPVREPILIPLVLHQSRICPTQHSLLTQTHTINRITQCSWGGEVGQGGGCTDMWMLKYIKHILL